MLFFIDLETSLNQIVLQGWSRGSKGPLNNSEAGQLPALGNAVGVGGGELILLV